MRRKTAEKTSVENKTIRVKKEPLQDPKMASPRTKRKQRVSLMKYIMLGLSVVGLLFIGYEIFMLHSIDNVGYFPSIKDGVFSRNDAFSAVAEEANFERQIVQNDFLGFRKMDIEDLGENDIVHTVHYVWCGNKTFTFKNYLSILSVWKLLRPDIIEFHMTGSPIYDKYNDWFDEIKRAIPGFVARAMPQHWDGEEKGCGFWFGLAVIDDRGGIFVDEDVIITEDVHHQLKTHPGVLFAQSTPNKKPKVAIAFGKEREPEYRTFYREFKKTETIPEHAKYCQEVDSTLGFNISSSTSTCYHIARQFNPRDIFELKSNFGFLARRLFYGSEKPKVVQSWLPDTIPNVVHYVWFGVKTMDFMMYLSILSTLYIVNVDKVFIHGDGGLTGKYFTRILKDKRVVIVLREKPLYIYGHDVLYAQHRSDIVRADVLLKYGGIYMDWDVLWLKSPADLLNSGYDAIVNFDHMQNGNFPESINLGVFLSKPQSTFVKRWQDALRHYKSNDFLYNAVELPYKIYERFPEYVFIERHLQVMCFRLKCHPTFQPDFKNFMEEQEFDWRRDTYAIHFTFPDPEELTNETACREGQGRFAEMGRYILEHEFKLPT